MDSTLAVSVNMWNLVLLYSSLFRIASFDKSAVLILARGGSKGVHLKNLQTVGGISLLRRSVAAARAAGLHDVSVSTDHPYIALEALRCGASVFKRNFQTATDWAPSIWGASEFVAHRPSVKLLILIQTTSPFTEPSDLKRALEIIQSPVPYDCVFAATRSYKLRWQETDKSLKPLNFDLKSRPRRQSWNGELIENGAFYIARRHLIEHGVFQNNK